MNTADRNKQPPVTAMASREQDLHFMRLALRLAEKARGNTSPNPLVGALLVHRGVIIGQGYHKKAGEPHAEILALQDCARRCPGGVTGATLYVTLEPCCHYGRTPPCTQAILSAGFISRVVVAVEDPNPLVAGKGIETLRQAGLEVVTGIGEQEARSQNEVFIKYITTGLPFITIKAAVSLDGKIATASGESRWITGEQARAYVQKLRLIHDAVMVGVGTVLKDDPRLTSRPRSGPARTRARTRQPCRIVVDSKGCIPLSAAVLDEQDKAKTLLAVTAQTPRHKVEALQDRGCEVLICRQESSGRVDLRDLCLQLAGKGITSVLMEGGGELNASLLKEQLVDKFMVFIAPKLIGGAAAPGFVMGEGVARLKDACALRTTRLKRYGEDFLLEAYPVRESEELMAGEQQHEKLHSRR